MTRNWPKLHRQVVFGESGGKIIWQPRIGCWYEDKMFSGEGLPEPYTGMMPHEVYRALIEATAFGTRRIIDSFEASGVPIKDIVACGGLPDKNKLLMQIYADITRREFSVAASSQAPALGSSMWAAVAAGAEALHPPLEIPGQGTFAIYMLGGSQHALWQD